MLLATPPATLLPLSNCPAGELHTQGIITAGGLIFCCIGNFFMFLSGANYALTMVRWGHRECLLGFAFRARSALSGANCALTMVRWGK